MCLLVRFTTNKQTKGDALGKETFNSFRLRNCVRDYILHTYWEKPCRLDQVRRAFDNYLRKATIIRELLDQHEKVGDSCNVKKEDIQALYLDPEWTSKWHTYRHELFEQSGSDRKGV